VKVSRRQLCAAITHGRKSRQSASACRADQVS
jgi:hypothetical protein